jgi:hypothetical protein|tara:strand:- start:1428 stop:1547 length:120 start_codon:yes stop_codon:yes gene_type:complete
MARGDSERRNKRKDKKRNKKKHPYKKGGRQRTMDVSKKN